MTRNRRLTSPTSRLPYSASCASRVPTFASTCGISSPRLDSRRFVLERPPQVGDDARAEGRQCVGRLAVEVLVCQQRDEARRERRAVRLAGRPYRGAAHVRVLVNQQAAQLGFEAGGQPGEQARRLEPGLRRGPRLVVDQVVEQEPRGFDVLQRSGPAEKRHHARLDSVPGSRPPSGPAAAGRRWRGGPGRAAPPCGCRSPGRAATARPGTRRRRHRPGPAWPGHGGAPGARGGSAGHERRGAACRSAAPRATRARRESLRAAAASFAPARRPPTSSIVVDGAWVSTRCRWMLSRTVWT